MIYRILINERVVNLDANNWDEYYTDRRQLRGPSNEMSDAMFTLLLPLPGRNHSHRARYYFTETGWRRIGRHLAAEARKRKFIVKIIRRKNPPASDVAYRDEVQLALLPRRGKR